MDEFLIGRNGIDGKIKGDDRTGPSFCSGTQCKIGTARQLAAGRSVTRRLRKAQLFIYYRVDPMGTRYDVDSGTNNSLGVGIVRRGHRNREPVARNASTNHASGQRLPYSPGDGDDEGDRRQERRALR